MTCKLTGLPDLNQLLACPETGQELLVLSFVGQAQGTLREYAGVPDGTPGILQTRQTGLLGTALQANPNTRVA